jgi:hypothetical protein
MNNSAGFCRCGKRLPSVRDYERPYEFCSLQCKCKAEADRRRTEDLFGVLCFLLVVAGVWLAAATRRGGQ